MEYGHDQFLLNKFLYPALAVNDSVNSCTFYVLNIKKYTAIFKCIHETYSDFTFEYDATSFSCVMIVSAVRYSNHQSPFLRRGSVPSSQHNMLTMLASAHFHKPARKSADLKNTQIGHVANYVQFQLMKVELNQHINKQCLSYVN